MPSWKHWSCQWIQSIISITDNVCHLPCTFRASALSLICFWLSALEHPSRRSYNGHGYTQLAKLHTHVIPFIIQTSDKEWTLRFHLACWIALDLAGAKKHLPKIFAGETFCEFSRNIGIHKKVSLEYFALSKQHCLLSTEVPIFKYRSCQRSSKKIMMWGLVRRKQCSS